jgi:hypothetical protein
MSSRRLTLPEFPIPPDNYDSRYLAEVVRAFSIFLQQTQNPGDMRGSTLALTQLQEDDYLLREFELFQRDGFIKIVRLDMPHPRGLGATASVGSVTVTTS